MKIFLGSASSAPFLEACIRYMRVFVDTANSFSVLMQTTEILIGRWLKGLVPPVEWVMSQVNMYGKENLTIREESGYNHWYAVSAPTNYIPPQS